MTEPVLVRAYTTRGRSSWQAPDNGKLAETLPPISCYAFADILRSADSPDFQTAIDGIAEICAKNRMSLADEYGSHLPPLGEITASTSTTMRPHLLRPGMRRALTSVPEASSGSSEGSRRSLRTGNLFGFRKRKKKESELPRRIRIGSMGRTVAADGTTALAADAWLQAACAATNTPDVRRPSAEAGSLPDRDSSRARASLQRILSADYGTQPS